MNSTINNILVVRYINRNTITTKNYSVLEFKIWSTNKGLNE